MACESGLGFRNVKTLLSSALNKFYYSLSPCQKSKAKKVVFDKSYIVEQLLTFCSFRDTLRSPVVQMGFFVQNKQ